MYRCADVLMELLIHDLNQSELGHKYKIEKNNEHENSINRLLLIPPERVGSPAEPISSE